MENIKNLVVFSNFCNKMESKASHRHQKKSKHTSRAPISSSLIQDSSFESDVLPADIITDILLKLPVKSLARFKCVSKSWIDLISSPEFVKAHLSVSANNPCQRLMLELGSPENNLKDCSVSYLLNDHVTQAIDMDFPPKKSHQSIQVIGSVNGLICVSIDEKDFFIWNPSIRKLKKLPSSRTGCFCMYGFGYDELNDDYKVVGITENVHDGNPQYTEGKVYSLNNNSWNHLDDLPVVILSHQPGTFVNGKIHWTTSKTFVYGNDWNIIAVNLADGRWGELEKPYYGERINLNFLPQLGLLGNNLSMCCQHQFTHANVWVMKEYGVKESWTKMFSIKYPNDRIGYSLLGPPFCMSSDEGEILLKNGRFFIIYNRNDESIRYSEVTNCHQPVEATLYIESLVWPFVSKHPRNASTSKAANTLMKTIRSTNNYILRSMLCLKTKYE